SLGGKPDAFLTGGLPPEETDILSYSFVKMLMSKAGPYQQLLGAVRSGAPFDQSFAKIYGYTPNQMAAAWAPKAASRRARVFVALLVSGPRCSVSRLPLWPFTRFDRR